MIRVEVLSQLHGQEATSKRQVFQVGAGAWGDTASLASKNVKCVGSSQYLRLDSSFVPTVRLQNCSELVDTI
jgi:hypothetical protein